MFKSFACAVAALLALTWQPVVPQDSEEASQPDTTFSARVESALDAGCAWLKAQQGLEDGEDPAVFGVYPVDPAAYARGEPHRYRIARTAFPVQALCTAGVFHDAPEIQKAMNYLRANYTEEGAIQMQRGKVSSLSYEDATVLMAVEAYYISAWEARERGLSRPASRFKKDDDGEFVKDANGERIPLLRWGTVEQGANKAPPGRRLKLERADARLCEIAVKALQARFRDDVYGGGGWRYHKAGVGLDNPQIDVSATQWAILGLKAASRLGLRYDKSILLKAFAFLKDQQDKQGPEVSERWKRGSEISDEERASASSSQPEKLQARGWGYARQSKDDPLGRISYGSMTAAGVNALIVIRDELVQDRALRAAWRAHEADCNQMIGDGLAWLIRNWDMSGNPKRGNFQYYYYLYTIERMAMLGGIDEIGGHDWYRQGAEIILRQQGDNGVWDVKQEIDPSDVYNTCYALLFLKRGTESIHPPAPVITGGDYPD